MLIDVLKSKKQGDLYYGQVTAVTSTVKRVTVKLSDNIVTEAAYGSSLADPSVGDLLLIGRTSGGAYQVIQSLSKEMPVTSDILNV